MKTSSDFTVFLWQFGEYHKKDWTFDLLNVLKQDAAENPRSRFQTYLIPFSGLLSRSVTTVRLRDGLNRGGFNGLRSADQRLLGGNTCDHWQRLKAQLHRCRLWDLTCAEALQRHSGGLGIVGEGHFKCYRALMFKKNNRGLNVVAAAGSLKGCLLTSVRVVKIRIKLKVSEMS